MPLIDRLTPEQEALIPVYREKWRKIAISTEPIDREKATEAVKYCYRLINSPEPEIIFSDRPDQTLEYFSLLDGEEKLVKLSYEDRLNQHQMTLLEISDLDILGKMKAQIDNNEKSIIWSYLSEELSHNSIQIFKAQMLTVLLGNRFLFEDIFAVMHYLILVGRCSLLDFCISVLNCNYDPEVWLMYQLLSKNCCWIFPLEKVCFVCDRPRILSFDNQQRLHAEGSPAIQFADGFSVYAYHGVRLPEEYGKLHPSQWRSEWLLTEENAELRRVLIEGIGYAKICQELQAIELDSWQEYSLLKIDNEIDVEPIYMLKMNCPSTGYTHALRVPPDMQTAREAIKWVNWGIDPEEFSVQT